MRPSLGLGFHSRQERQRAAVHVRALLLKMAMLFLERDGMAGRWKTDRQTGLKSGCKFKLENPGLGGGGLCCAACSETCSRFQGGAWPKSCDTGCPASWPCSPRQANFKAMVGLANHELELGPFSARLQVTAPPNLELAGRPALKQLCSAANNSTVVPSARAATQMRPGSHPVQPPAQGIIIVITRPSRHPPFHSNHHHHLLHNHASRHAAPLFCPVREGSSHVPGQPRSCALKVTLAHPPIRLSIQPPPA